MSTTRAAIAAALLVLAGAPPAAAESSLNLEVREPTKGRLTSADIWIKALGGKVVRKVFAAAGRLKLSKAPVGTFNLEARTRVGNLIGRGRVVIKANALARVVIRLKPAPKPAPKPKPIVAKLHKGGPATPKVTAAPPPGRRAAARGQPRSRGRGPATARRGGQGPAPVKLGQAVPVPVVAKKAAAHDWGKGKVRVCQGDVFDAKGRRISGKIQLRGGGKAIGFANVAAGRFSLYDLGNGTYQLRFSTLDNKRHAVGNVAVVKGKLARAVLRVP